MGTDYLRPPTATQQLTWTRDGYAWTAAWSGTAPFKVYLEGHQVGEDTDATAMTFNHTDDQEPPAVEVLDDNDTVTPNQLAFPPFATLQWLGNTDAAHYRVEDGGVQEATITENGSGYYRHVTGTIEDGTNPSYTVTPVDAQGNDGDTRTIDTAVIFTTCPAPPSITMSYDEDDDEIDVEART